MGKKQSGTTKSGINIRKNQIGSIQVIIGCRTRKQNNFHIWVKCEDIPSRPFPFRYYTEEFIKLMVKEAIAQEKHTGQKITSRDILETIRFAFLLFMKPQSKRAMGYEKCKQAIVDTMKRMIGC